MATPNYQTTRIWTQTLRKLRLLAVLREMSIVHLLNSLADEELKRVGKEDLSREQEEKRRERHDAPDTTSPNA